MAALRDADYDSLPLDLRISMLCALCQLAMDSPTVRETLERRLDELQRIKRATWEESKAEATLQRQRRHAEQAAKLRAQAEEAHKHLERLKAMANGETLPPGSEEKPKEEPKEEVKPEPMDVDGQAGVSAAAARAVPSAAELAIAAAEDGGNEDREAAQKRAQARAESTLREMEANAVRAEPLGTDRRYNRYWRFVRGDGDLLAGDACAGRVFVESDADGTLRMLCSVESLEALMASLDRQGPREQALYASLMRHRASLSGTMPSRPLDMPAPAAPLPLEAAASMWTLAAPSAASAGALEPFLPGEAAVVTKLKADMLAVHGALGDDDVDAEFDADDWKHSVRDAGDVAALRLALGKLEAAILPDALHPRFVKEPLLVRGAWIPSSGEVATALPGSTAADVLLSPLPPPAQAAEDNGDGTPGTADGEPAPPEPLVWLPPTVSAVAMRLCALDSALKYDAGAPAREAMDGYRFILRPGKLADAKNGLVRGMPIDHMGLVTPVIFPPFPHRLLFSPRIDFTFPVAQFQSDVATNSDALIAPSTTGRAKAVHAGSRIGSRGRPKGSKNKAKGGGAPGSGAAGKAPGKKRTPGGGMGQRSALNRELGGRSDSDQHYGSDLDDGDEEDEAFLGELVPHMAPQFNHNNSVAPSAGPSTAPSTAGDDEDEEISEDDGAQGGAESEGDAA